MEQNRKYIEKKLDNRYTVKKQIGSGGMSVVYLAHDEVMNRPVAIKMLRDELLSDHDAVERFCNEAKAILMLSHENIIKGLVFSNGDDIKYIVMEYVDGETLKSYIARKGKLSPSESIDIAIGILSALDHAHSKNVVHRDVKPQNILLPKGGGLKISDFGIAKLPTNDPLNVSCTTVGTVDYISPEQARGKTIDRRSDIYSLGIMLYEMASGSLPFVGENPMEVAYKQIGDQPEPLSAVCPDIPKGFEQVVMKAICKEPSGRFDSAKQMLDCLDRLRSNPDATFDFVTLPIDDSPESTDDILFSGSYVSALDKKGFDSVEKVAKGKKSKKLGKKEIIPKKKKKEKKEKKVVVKTEVKEKHARVSLVSILLGALCALCVVGLTAFLFVYELYFAPLMNPADSQTLIVGDFEGQVYTTDLQRRLEEAGYMVTVEWVSDADHIYGTVISQSPKKNARRQIIKGETYCDLTLKLSMGESMTVLDNYVGLEYRYAGILFSEKKINVNFVKVFSDTMPQGRIISTYPEAGTRITKDTTVTAYVSKGPDVDYSIVPSLVGLTISQAATALEKANLAAGKVTYVYSDTVDAGKIISQEPYRGEAVPDKLTTIDFVVSLGPEHPITTEPPITTIPPITTDPSITPPTTGDLPVTEPPTTTTPPTTPTTTAPITTPPTPITDPTIPSTR